MSYRSKSKEEAEKEAKAIGSLIVLIILAIVWTFDYFTSPVVSVTGDILDIEKDVRISCTSSTIGGAIDPNWIKNDASDADIKKKIRCKTVTTYYLHVRDTSEKVQRFTVTSSWYTHREHYIGCRITFEWRGRWFRNFLGVTASPGEPHGCPPVTREAKAIPS